MAQWDLVFTTGEHTDGNGNKKVWTEADLDRIVALFNPKFHEPPLVLGHPSDNAPAFGWVEQMKRIGTGLYVAYKGVVDEFKEWNRKGMFKKKSIALYPNGMLRHVGYLGAMPPAIKGLPDFAFADGDLGKPVVWEFCDMDDMTIAGLFRRLREFIISKFDKETADQVIPDYEVTGLQVSACMPDEKEVDDMGLTGPTYKEAEMDQKAFDALSKRVEGLEAGIKSINDSIAAFGETMKGLNGTITAIQTQFTQGEEAAARREFTAFCEGLKTRILPAEIPTIVDQMMNLRKATDVEFSEGGETKKRSAVDDFKLKLQGRAETVQFGEFATGDLAGQREAGGEDAVAIAQKAQEFQDAEAKAGRTITIADAVTHVRNEAGKGGAR